MPRAKEPTMDTRLKEVGLFLKEEGLDIAWDRLEDYVRIGFKGKNWVLEKEEARKLLNRIQNYYEAFENNFGKDRRKISIRMECWSLVIARKWLIEKGEWK